jgi:8-oxo-dGTP diphosphatase
MTKKQRYPALAVDGVVLKENKILLIKRRNEPFKGKFALPGGFVKYGEQAEDAVRREVFEETSCKTKIRKLLGVYSDPKRDPRGHVVSIVYLLESIGGDIKAGSDALDAEFIKISGLPPLAFDHKKIISDALKSLRGKT